uniref:Uncharacterized protein n=1 Tax=Arundo donax TaxID=35708 RepID=A0A0A9A6A5_ARUDO
MSNHNAGTSIDLQSRNRKLLLRSNYINGGALNSNPVLQLHASICVFNALANHFLPGLHSNRTGKLVLH